MPYFRENPLLKVAEVFALGGRQIGVFCGPSARVRWILAFDLMPSETLPLTEVDLAQCRGGVAFDGKGFCDCLCGCVAPAKIAGVNSADVLVANPPKQSFQLKKARCIEFGVGVAAEGSGHVG